MRHGHATHRRGARPAGPDPLQLASGPVAAGGAGTRPGTGSRLSAVTRDDHSSRPKLERPPGARLKPRPRRTIDWELVVCGCAGHALVGADAAELRPQDELYAREQGPTRWLRCLRCDSWVALARPQHPARRYPPGRESIRIPRRGKALRDRLVLRAIAIDRLIHCVIFAALGIGALAIASNGEALRGRFYRVLTDLENGGAGGAAQSGRHVGFFHALDKLFSLRAGTLHELGIVLLAYALLEGFEAVGLWLTKRWAEYLTFIASTLLIPLEIYEIIHRGTALKVIAVLINLAVAAYLIVAKRLFGVRGGGKADEYLRARDTSWESLERASPPAFEAAR